MTNANDKTLLIDLNLKQADKNDIEMKDESKVA